MTPKVKVCCIASLEEAHTAVEHGASALGLVSAMPSGPGVIDEGLIAGIAAEFLPPTGTFLLTSRTDFEGIAEQHLRCRTNTLQLVDHVEPDVHRELRRRFPEVTLVQVIHVNDERSVDDALAAADTVDALLLDSGKPDLDVKELGGTGRTHDWALSARIVERSPVPVFLAGGLNPDNVTEAIEAVRPFGLDLCTGIRTHGTLDADKLAAFMAAVESADR